MKKFFGVLAAAAVMAFSPVSSLAQTGPAGEWTSTMNTPQGATNSSLELKVDGDKVTGQLSNAMGPVGVTGTTADNAVKLSAEINIQGMSLTLAIDGKVTGDAMEGTVAVGDFGQFPFTGKRAGKAAAAATPAPTAAAAGGATITDLNGKWDVKLIVAGMGEMPATAVLTQTGEKLTGTLSGPAGDLAIAGTVTGKNVKIDFEADTPQGKLAVTMTGEIGATSVVGKASIAGMGEADWTATRAANQ